MATEDAGKLKEFAVNLKEKTAALLNNVGKLYGMDFKEITNNPSKKYYSRFQEASENIDPYWKRYCKLNNRLDYLPPQL